MMTTQIRRLKDKAFYIVISILSGIIVLPLFLIIGELIIKGYRQINIDFFIKATPSTLEALLARSTGDVLPGGIANGIIGTLLMAILASFFAIILGIMTGIYLSENREGKFASFIRFASDLIQGTPSIVIGIIVYAWIVVPFSSYSGYAGAFALSVMMLPLIIRSTEETLKMIPNTLKEAGLALGGSYTSVVLKILLPSSLGGILTGILLSLARIMGETAPLLMTALGSTSINFFPSKPTSAVPLLIWEFYNDPNMSDMIWSSSLFLLIITLCLNLAAKHISRSRSI